MTKAFLKLGANGRPAPLPARGDGNRRVSEAQNQRLLRARFDSQFTTDENRRHWALADASSVDASANWMVRRLLRTRSRYEYHNNCYFQGIAKMLANYCIGTGRGCGCRRKASG